MHHALLILDAPPLSVPVRRWVSRLGLGLTGCPGLANLGLCLIRSSPCG